MMTKTAKRAGLASALLSLVVSADAAAQDDLAKQAQNPIANMISVPFQNNTNFGIGPYNRTQNVLNIQPVIPFNLTKDWLVVSRWIMPIVYQPDVSERSGGRFGLGDFSPSFFFVPSSRLTGLPKNLLIGIGPALQLPTATSSRLGAQKWGLGPTAVIVYTPGKWVLGALANNIWSLGDGSKGTNQFLVQPFVNYNMSDGWYLVSAPVITANWNLRPSERWIVPLGGGVGKILKVGKLPLNVTLQAYYNLVETSVGPDWTLRFQVQLLFPRK